MADMNLDGDVTRTHSQEQIIITAVDTQTFAAVVDKGIRYGYLSDLLLAVGSGDIPKVEVSGRLQSIVLWKDFQQIQLKILKILPSKHKLSKTETANRAYLCGRRKKPKIVDSEKSLKNRQEEALTGPVEFLIKELEHITNL
ncbi:hypothetical protein E4U52_002827 [Claviceps spartinae]|nr:hypothetical protein E4U52_002827 [Claviceps spartinae]